MPRRLFIFPLILALLPLLAAAALWIQSYAKPVTLGVHYFPNTTSAWDFYGLHSTAGTLIYEHLQDSYWVRADSPLRSRSRWVWGTTHGPADDRLKTLRITRFSQADGGFDADDNEHGNINGLEFPIPYWLITLCAVLFPALLLTRRLLKRHPLQSFTLCPNCNYDLRAHLSGAAGDKCPECGTLIPAAKSAPSTPPPSSRNPTKSSPSTPAQSLPPHAPEPPSSVHPHAAENDGSPSPE